MKRLSRHYRHIVLLAAALLGCVAGSLYTPAQQQSPALQPPPPPPTPYLDQTAIPDSVILPLPVQTTVPQGYEDYIGREYAADLRDPENIKTEVEYDPATKMYWIRTRLGDREIVTPYLMTTEQYRDMQNRREMFNYFQDKNSEIFEKKQ